MKDIFKLARWIGCIPVGLVGGTLIAIAGVGVVDLCLDRCWLTGCLGLLAAGLSYPVVVYRLGMRIAPDREELSRNLMLLANWLLLFLASIDLTQILLGIGTDEPDYLVTVSFVCAAVCIDLGTAVGALLVFWLERAEAAATASEEGWFDWDAPIKQPQLHR